MATSVKSMSKKVVQSGAGLLSPAGAGAAKGYDIGLPLVVIAGPTASGKSATAMEIAREFNGEIICSDSRTIYKGLDIGTAKPSASDQAEVPHWGLDIATPGDVFTAADFKSYALKAIADIRSRGRLPILVGGTGLYVDGVIFDYEFQKTSPELRAELERRSLEELVQYCADNNIALPENEKNRRHVINAIVRNNAEPKGLSSPIDNTLIVGIATDRDVLRQRIRDRAGQLFSDESVAHT